MNIKSYLNITRPGNCFFSMLCVIFGGLYYRSSYINIYLVFAVISAALIAAGGYIINDVYDLEIDRINKPDRVLPSGKINIKNAVRYYFIITVIGLILSVFTNNLWNILLAGVNSILLLLYAKKYKKTLIFGNLLVAYMASSTFLFGALVTKNVFTVLPLVYFSFFYTLLREWVKTIEDEVGDRENKANTMAVVFTSAKTARLSYFPTLMIILGVYAFYLLDFFNSIVFFSLNFLVSVPLVFGMVILNKSQHPKVIRKIHFYMKIDMLILLMIFLVQYVAIHIYYLFLMRA